MAEYYPLLARAVAGMRNAPPEQRQAIYDRARQALLGQLRSMQPPVPEESIQRESTALDEAITRLEADFLPPPPPSPAEEQPPASDPDRPAAASDPPPAPPPPIVAPPTPPEPDVPVQPRPPAQRPPAEALSRIVATRGPVAPIIRAARYDQSPVPPPAEPPAARPTTLPIAPRLAMPSFADTLNAVETDAEDAVRADSGAPPADKDIAAPREEPPRPLAPRPTARERFNPRFLILAAVGIAVVAGIAYAAWRLRDKPEALARARAAMIAAQQAEPQNQKLNTRIEGGAAPAKPTIEPAPATTAQDPPTAPATRPANADAPAPAAAVPAPQSAAPTAAPQAADDAPPAAAPVMTVAQRAGFLIQGADQTQKVQAYSGTVVWSAENTSPAPNQPLARAIHAEIDIPDIGVKLSMTFQKNDEQQLPASHTIQLRFTAAANSAAGPIKQISVPELRGDNSDLGDKLTGLAVTITDNSFLVGLSRGEAAEAHNLDLIKTRNWIDIPLGLASGKAAKITFEQGNAGRQVIADVMQSWQ